MIYHKKNDDRTKMQWRRKGGGGGGGKIEVITKNLERENVFWEGEKF